MSWSRSVDSIKEVEVEESSVVNTKPEEKIEVIEPEKSDQYVIVHIQGGLGKHVAATAVMEGIRTKYPSRKIILVCGYPEIFLFNPYVDRVYAIGNTPYFYDDYIKDKDSIILKQEPYDTTGHIKQERHLIESWYEAFNLPYNQQLPALYHNYRYNEVMAEKYYRSKPILLLQTNGGPYRADGNYEPGKSISWSRDLNRYTSEKIVKEVSGTYHVIQVTNCAKNALPGVEVISTPLYNLELLSLVRVATKRILIDSCLQHAAAAFRLPSTVLWNGTSPKVFGYGLHANILPKSEHLQGFKNLTAYLYDYELWGNPIQCPYNNNDLYDINQILNSIQ